MNYDNTKLIDRIRLDISSRNQVIKELYKDKTLKDSIYSLILKNGGSIDDAHDMFTQSLISFVQQCYSPVFVLNNQLGTYLYSIARYAWIAKCKKEKKYTSFDIGSSETDFEPSIESKIIDQEKLNLIRKGLTYLDEKCKEVMTMWASQLKMREIAIRMNYASEQVARKKKHQCLNKLKSIIQDI